VRQSQQRGHFQRRPAGSWGLPRQTVRSLSLPPLRGRSVHQDRRGAKDLPLSRSEPLPVHATRFTVEGASPATRLVAEQLLQGLPKIAPPSTSPPVSTPGVRGRSTSPAREKTALPGAFGIGLPSPPRVPSSWFCTTSTACSTGGSQACCILLPTLGFIGFLRVRSADRRTLPHRCPTLQSLSTCKAVSPSPETAALLPFQVCVPSGDLVASRPCSLQASAAPAPPLPEGSARSSLGLPTPESIVLDIHHGRPVVRTAPEGTVLPPRRGHPHPTVSRRSPANAASQHHPSTRPTRRRTLAALRQALTDFPRGRTRHRVH
jgi:hypothetical protein